MPLRPKPNPNQPWPSLIPMRNGEPLPPIILTDPSILIGSGDAAQIRLRSKLVSKAHALLLVDGGRAYVRDLASRGHLWVNEEAVREAELAEGDVVRVGTFRFVLSQGATADAAAAPAVRLRVGRDGEERRIAERVVLMGRRGGSDVRVEDESVSQGHVVLFWVNGGWHVRDLGSRTGTRVNGAAVRQQTEVRVGEVIEFGAAEVTFVGVEESVAPAPVVADGRARPGGLGAFPTEAGQPVPAEIAATLWAAGAREGAGERAESGADGVIEEGALALPGTPGVDEGGGVVVEGGVVDESSVPGPVEGGVVDESGVPGPVEGGGGASEHCVGWEPEGGADDERTTAPAPVLEVLGLLTAAAAAKPGGSGGGAGDSAEGPRERAGDARPTVTVWGFEELARRVKPGASGMASDSDAPQAPVSRWRRCWGRWGWRRG